MNLHELYKNVGLTLLAFVAMTSCISIYAWSIGAQVALADATAPIMRMNTSICFLISAITWAATLHNKPGWWWIHTRAIGTAIVFFFPLAILSQYFTGVDLGIDQIFAPDPYSNFNTPGRMSIIASSLFPLTALISFLMFFKNKAASVASKLLAAFGLTIAMEICIGYFLGLPYFYKITPGASMSFPAAVLFVCIFTVSLLSRFTLVTEFERIKRPAQA